MGDQSCGSRSNGSTVRCSAPQNPGPPRGCGEGRGRGEADMDARRRPAVKSPARLAIRGGSGYHHGPAPGADHAPTRPPLRAVVLAPLSRGRRPRGAGCRGDRDGRRGDDRPPRACGRRHAAGHCGVAAAGGRLERDGAVPRGRASAADGAAPGGRRDRLLARPADQRAGGAALSGLGGPLADGGALPTAGPARSPTAWRSWRPRRGWARG